MKTRNNTNSRNTFTIYRDVLRNANGENYALPFPRQFLRITAKGRYIWTDDRQKATPIGCNNSCHIINNLNSYGNFCRFNYGKIHNR